MLPLRCSISHPLSPFTVGYNKRAYMLPVSCSVLFCFEGARLSDDMTHNCSHTAKAEGMKIWGMWSKEGETEAG